MPTNSQENQQSIPITVVSRNPNIEHPENAQSIEQKPNLNEQAKQPFWKKAWQKMKNLRNNFNKNPDNQNNNMPESEPKNKNKIVQLVKERLEQVKNFNQLSSKEQAEIINLAILALTAVVASSAFLIPTGLTVAGYASSALGLTTGATSVGGITIPSLTTLAGTSGSFGTYGLFNTFGAANLATTTAGMYGVQAGTAAIGTGLFFSGKKLADRCDKLTKKYIDKLLLKSQIPVQTNLQHNQLGISNPNLPTPVNNQNNPGYISLEGVVLPSATVALNQSILANNNPEVQKKPSNNLNNLLGQKIHINNPENQVSNAGYIQRVLNLDDAKYRYNYIMSSDNFNEEQKDNLVKLMLNDVFLRFKGGAKDIESDQIVQICLLTNNYEMWQKVTKEIGIKNGLKRSEMDLTKEKFEKTKNRP